MGFILGFTWMISWCNCYQWIDRSPPWELLPELRVALASPPRLMLTWGQTLLLPEALCTEEAAAAWILGARSRPCTHLLPPHAPWARWPHALACSPPGFRSDLPLGPPLSSPHSWRAQGLPIHPIWGQFWFRSPSSPRWFGDRSFYFATF